VLELTLSADELVTSLLRISKTETVCILDSCGVGHLGSHLLIAGIRPVDLLEISNDDPEETLRLLDEKLVLGMAAMFTLSYDFGVKVQQVSAKIKPTLQEEPDLFLALFDALVVHDYDSGKTFVIGDHKQSPAIEKLVCEQVFVDPDLGNFNDESPSVTSNFTKSQYIDLVERIRERIRSGDTYQTNLTQQLRCKLSPRATPASTFWRLRRDHPAPFAAFLRRLNSTVLSASPERFFRISRSGHIEASPIKGTRARGSTKEEDASLRAELESSVKDRAENVMIVDLVRNDLGRVCEFGSVTVEKLCDVEEHPTLFHLVSTVRGKLRNGVKFSEILRSTFPCGSITGAPKIRTMQIIDEIETADRRLSMGAIGIYFPKNWDLGDVVVDTEFDLSVAIRTMTISDDEAVFNVGGGIVIDSDPEKEYDETMLKARALLNSIGAR